MDAVIRNRILKQAPARRDVSASTRTFTDVHYYYLIAATWSIPVVLTLLSVAGQAVFPCAILASVVSGIVLILKPKAALVALPFFALLSPVAGFLEILDTRVLLSDLLFVLLAIQLVILFFQKQLTFRSPYSLLVLSAAVLLLASCLAGFITNTLISVKPVLYMLQLAVVYFYTISFAKDEKSWGLIINSWLVAAFLGSLLLIQGYMTGQALENFKYGFDSQLARETLRYLFRASYYYSGFHYTLGIAIVVLFIRFLSETSIVPRILTLGALSVFSTALVMMANRTAMFSIAIAITGVLVLSFRFQKAKRFKMLTALIVLVSLVTLLVLGGLLRYMGENQAEQWVARLSGGSEARWEVYAEAMTVWFTYPIHILTGMGPDFLDGSGDPAISTPFKVSGLTGLTQGTVDSGWISYLIEAGVITFAVLVAIFVRSLTSVLKYLKQIQDGSARSTEAVALFGALLFITIALSTQMLGYTKLTWLPFQLLIIGLMHKNFINSGRRRRERSFVLIKHSRLPLKGSPGFAAALHNMKQEQSFTQKRSPDTGSEASASRIL